MVRYCRRGRDGGCRRWCPGSLAGAAVPQMLTCRWTRGEDEGGGNLSCARAASKHFRAGEADGHSSPVKQPRLALGGPHFKHCSAPPLLGSGGLRAGRFSSSFQVNAAAANGKIMIILRMCRADYFSPGPPNPPKPASEGKLTMSRGLGVRVCGDEYEGKDRR